MSTRCRIGIDKGDGVIRSIYCHHDGYLKGGVGETLRDYYRLVNKADKLIRLGDISSLGPEPVSCPENWVLGINPFYEGKPLTLAYKDCPDEDNVKPKTSETYRDFFELCCDSGAGHAYVFDPNKKDWKAYFVYTPDNVKEYGWVSEVIE